jgi:hypothetical protein
MIAISNYLSFYQVSFKIRPVPFLLDVYTKNTYIRYKTGEREIPLRIAIEIANYYKVSLDYLAGMTKRKN